MSTITGLVLTYNGARLLEKCLASLDFCDKILVVDSYSTDDTLRIANSAGAQLIQRPWEGAGPQLKFALEHIKTEWVVSLDQDEFLSSTLRQAIIDTLQTNQSTKDIAGYYVYRRSFYYNRFMKHSGWYPDKLFRVFRPQKLEITVSGAHEHLRPLGKNGHLPYDIIHYPYKNFHEHLHKINAYAEQGAIDLRKKGKKSSLGKALIRAKFRFIKLYFLKLGLLDGQAGFINALAGAYYAFQKHIRITENKEWGKPYGE